MKKLTLTLFVIVSCFTNAQNFTAQKAGKKKMNKSQRISFLEKELEAKRNKIAKLKCRLEEERKSFEAQIKEMRKLLAQSQKEYQKVCFSAQKLEETNVALKKCHQESSRKVQVLQAKVQKLKKDKKQVTQEKKKATKQLEKISQKCPKKSPKKKHVGKKLAQAQPATCQAKVTKTFQLTLDSNCPQETQKFVHALWKIKNNEIFPRFEIKKMESANSAKITWSNTKQNPKKLFREINKSFKNQGFLLKLRKTAKKEIVVQMAS